MNSVAKLLVVGLLVTVDSASFFPRISIPRISVPTIERIPSIPRNNFIPPRDVISNIKLPTFNNDWINNYRPPSFPSGEIPPVRVPESVENPTFNNAVEPKPVLVPGLKRQSDIVLDNINNNNNNAYKSMPDPIKSPSIYNDPVIAIEHMKALFLKAVKSSSADLFAKELGQNKGIEPKPDTLPGPQRQLDNNDNIINNNNNNNNNNNINNNNNNLYKQIPDPMKSAIISKDPLVIMEQIKASLAKFAEKSAAKQLTKEGLPSELAEKIGLEHKLGLPPGPSDTVADNSDNKPAESDPESLKSPNDNIEPADKSIGSPSRPRIYPYVVPDIGAYIPPSPVPVLFQSSSNNNGNGLDAGCDPGVALVECPVDPCSGSSCPGVPGAVCRSNKCGGCSASWFNGQAEVTSRCNTTPAIGG